MNKKCKRLAWSLWFIIYILHSHNLSVQKKKKHLQKVKNERY